ncbi:MAG TPA: hypothetical protein DCQ06_03550 [Myxococcales bacterium]|nr:hypothetical protein [Myxococcales bacterium]HAN30652.1 hypothetical protein [Myxococcales bacterium]
MKRTLALSFICSLLSVFGCGGSYSPSGASFSGGAPGSPCDPQVQLEGCLWTDAGYAVMRCTTNQVWQQQALCSEGQFCQEQSAGDSAAPSKQSASCIAPASGNLDAGAANSNDSGAVTLMDTNFTGDTLVETHDTSVPDSGAPDVGAPDTAAPDAGAPDTKVPDTSAADTWTADTKAPDTSSPDTTAPDTVAPDTSSPDAGPVLKVPLPNVVLIDINSGSPTAGQQVKIAQFAGKYIAVLMGAGWCASCKAQAAFMDKIQKDALKQGRSDVVMIVVNDKSAGSSSNKKAMSTCNFSGVCTTQGAALTFPVLQGTSSYGWQSFVDTQTGQKGKKNDCFIYGPDGSLLFKHVGKGTVNLTQFDQEVRKTIAL